MVSRTVLGFWIIVAYDCEWEGSLLPEVLWHMLKALNAVLSTLWFVIDGALVRYRFCSTDALFFCILGSLLSATFSFVAKLTNAQSRSRCKKQWEMRSLKETASICCLHTKPVCHCAYHSHVSLTHIVDWVIVFSVCACWILVNVSYSICIQNLGSTYCSPLPKAMPTCPFMPWIFRCTIPPSTWCIGHHCSFLFISLLILLFWKGRSDLYLYCNLPLYMHNFVLWLLSLRHIYCMIKLCRSVCQR